MPRHTKPANKLSLKASLIRSNDSGWHYLLFDANAAASLGFTGRYRRVLCSINGTEPFHCALMPSGEQFYIIVNKKKRDLLGIVAGDKVDVVLERDESRYGLPMPPEISEVLRQDTEGDKLFHALTPGKQRSMLYWLSRTKDVDRRIHEALVLIEHLKKNGGSVDGRKLQDEMGRPLF